jgi:arginyl-tRNA synthetase
MQDRAPENSEGQRFDPALVTTAAATTRSTVAAWCGQLANDFHRWYPAFAHTPDPAALAT